MINDHLVPGITRPTWDESFMMVAILAATRGSCLKRAVGAALVKGKRVIASGYAGAAPGVKNCLELGFCFYEDVAHQDSKKGLGDFNSLKEQRKFLCLAVHAEANALAQCARYGVSSEGAVLYVTNYPCPSCVQNEILAKGLSGVMVWKEYLSNPLITLDEKRASQRMLLSAGVSIGEVDLSNDRIKQISEIMTMVGSRTGYDYKPDN